jgi:hypothetical protein
MPVHRHVLRAAYGPEQRVETVGHGPAAVSGVPLPASRRETYGGDTGNVNFAQS